MHDLHLCISLWTQTYNNTQAPSTCKTAVMAHPHLQHIQNAFVTTDMKNWQKMSKSREKSHGTMEVLESS